MSKPLHPLIIIGLVLLGVQIGNCLKSSGARARDKVCRTDCRIDSGGHSHCRTVCK